MSLVPNSEIKGRKLKYGKSYKCSNCDSYVGVYPNSTIPFGILADKELRTLQNKAHSLFDPIWISGEIGRIEAYKSLAKKLNIPFSKYHLSWFDKDVIRKVIATLEEGV